VDPETDDQRVRRRLDALYCIRAQIDLFFADAGYGSMPEADALASKIMLALVREKRIG
jgi:hypothetical protein